jgi:hypothetical protein
LGFDIEHADFDGNNVIEQDVDGRKVFFTGWMQEGPLGYVEKNIKYIYDPMQDIVSAYNVREDPHELRNLERSLEESQRIISEILSWRKSTFFALDQVKNGRMILYDRWICRWTDRFCSAKYDYAMLDENINEYVN